MAHASKTALHQMMEMKKRKIPQNKKKKKKNQSFF